MNLLDRPVWSSLTTVHERLSEGYGLARRYDPEVNRLAGARDDSCAALQELEDLVESTQQILLLQVPEIVLPFGLTAVRTSIGVQMVARAPLTAPDDRPEVVHQLGDDDATEMLALATLTKPGPFTLRTHCMGRFLGIRVDGQLVAMAGERLRLPGHAEISSICVHPRYRGRGYARHLACHVAAAICARGDVPFVHFLKHHAAAIALYEPMGFRWRADVHIAALQRS